MVAFFFLSWQRLQQMGTKRMMSLMIYYTRYQATAALGPQRPLHMSAQEQRVID
jgi:hypothetical protein